MVEITTMRIWMGISIVWPLFWMLVFDRWFFLSPLGLLIAFGIPIGGWVFWSKFYRDEKQKQSVHRLLATTKGAELVLRLKKRFIHQ